MFDFFFQPNVNNVNHIKLYIEIKNFIDIAVF